MVQDRHTMFQPSAHPGPFTAVVESTADLVFVVDDEDRCRYVNPSVIETLGYDRARLEDRSLFELVHPDDEPTLEAALGTGRRNQLRFETAGGEWLWVAVTGSDLSGFDVDGTVLTARRVAERQRLADRVRRFLEHTSDMLAVLDEEGRYRYVSQSVEHVFGYDPEELIDENALELIHPDDIESVLAEFQRTVEEPGYATTVEYRYRSAESEWRWLESRGRSLPSTRVYDGHVVVISRDIGERKRREQELRRQNERLDRFTSVVSHDLRNPLSVLEGSLELADSDDEHVERARECVDRMHALVDDLLSMARHGERVTDPEPVDLAAAAREAWGMVETGDATVDVETTATIDGNPDAVRQLFENLFRNSVEHGSGDGPVSVTVTDTDWGFVVADDGVGFDHDPEQAFEPGYTTATEGSGFGLSIVRNIAEAHDWDVIATESDDGGARFEFVTRAER